MLIHNYVISSNMTRLDYTKKLDRIEWRFNCRHYLFRSVPRDSHQLQFSMSTKLKCFLFRIHYFPVDTVCHKRITIQIDYVRNSSSPPSACGFSSTLRHRSSKWAWEKIGGFITHTQPLHITKSAINFTIDTSSVHFLYAIYYTRY